MQKDTIDEFNEEQEPITCLPEPKPLDHASNIRLLFQERCDQAKQKWTQEMTSSDVEAFHNPQNLSEYNLQLYNKMLELEDVHRISPHDYLKTVQTDVKDT